MPAIHRFIAGPPLIASTVLFLSAFMPHWTLGEDRLFVPGAPAGGRPVPPSGVGGFSRPGGVFGWAREAAETIPPAVTDAGARRSGGSQGAGRPPHVLALDPENGAEAAG